MYSNEVIERTLINELHNTVQAGLRETKRYGNVLQRESPWEPLPILGMNEQGEEAII